MAQLTENQKEFILKRFFENEIFAGWKNVATKLLENGFCIVAGNECIWRGNIGNFIDTEPSQLAVDCLEYRFDLDEFLKSKWFKEIKNEQIIVLNSNRSVLETEYKANKNKLNKQFTEIQLLGTFIPKPKWDYSVSSNSIWGSFDSGTVEAETYEEALQLAITELNHNFYVVNLALSNFGHTVEFSESSIELEKQK